MTRKEYEEELSKLDAKLYNEDISKDEIDKLVQDIERLHEKYSYYDKEILEETLNILKSGATYAPTKRRERKYTIKLITEGF